MNLNKKILISMLDKIVILTIILALNSCRKSDYVVEEKVIVVRDVGGGTGSVTWTSNHSYLLEGLVFVNDGQELTIEPGTVIRCAAGQGSASTALIVARGGRIVAEGTREQPIIFTAEADDLQGSVPLDGTGLWGGVIICGNARVNLSSGEGHVEGIPFYESRGTYGGNNDEDDSGILRYVSIRHGGTNIGEGNEINGLTLAAVGSKTIIDHIEVISNTDDGIEVFGGTVSMKFISIAFCGDDAFDYDLGYQGYIQFMLAIQSPSRGDKLIEGSGGIDPITAQPYSLPVIHNGTFIGRGPEFTEKCVAFNRNAGGTIANSIFIHQNEGVSIEYIEGSESSYQQYVNDNLRILSNIFNELGTAIPDSILKVSAAEYLDITDEQAALSTAFSTNLNSICDPGVHAYDQYYAVLPTGNVYDNLAPLPSPWFDDTIYKGAFYTYLWISEWSLLHQSGLVP
jgi:hypothetical protein